MKRKYKVVGIFLVAVTAIVIYFFGHLLLFIMAEPSDETKIADTKEAFKKVQFDQRVFKNQNLIKELNNFLSGNIETIFLFYHKDSLDISNFENMNKMMIFPNTINNYLPDTLALEMKRLLSQLPERLVTCSVINNDHSISYSISPLSSPTKSNNYRQKHRLNYGFRKEVVSDVHSAMGHLSKDTLIRPFQYYLEIESYVGW